ncbi:DUF2242 domain-containing protein [Marilutibacter alkalisoli]|uniref:DUF2242 domain-containing protein n=1 Tax=Marilutibacter alkalisoli TaxID=2591633 RepID=A0A514BNH7_9GAMM|nr:DUF2242 domain-containing protein [Lysobacter alkalisoli]QDH68948.1 DUF2242 domain-containing protein [Lysobacter alkalisoli]
MFRVRPFCRFTVLAVVLTSSLAACGWNRKAEPPPSGETFGAGDTYSRTYLVPPAMACEATRRALLGQGYVISKSAPDALEATKSFQPESDVHTQLNVRSTCLPQPGGGSIVFVNAVQDRYVLNTTVKSASVGVSMLGSVSLPIGSSGANLVRVASNTVQNQDFYRRFFELVAYYVPSTEGLAPPPPPPVFEPLPDPEPPVPTPIAPSLLDEASDPPAGATDPS